MEPTTKKCSKCDEVKALSLFYKARKGLFGKESSCKKCRLEQNAKYRIGNAEKENARCRAHYNTNIEKERARSVAYRAANPDKKKEASRLYALVNPEKNKAKCQRRWEELRPTYVAGLISQRLGIPTAIIRQHPELIERTALVLQGKRIFKQLKQLKQLNQPTSNQQPNG